MKKILIIVFLTLSLFGIGFLFIKKDTSPLPLISSFEDCLRAGYPVMESYPRQCKDNNGKTYSEITGSEIIYTNASSDMIVVDSPIPRDTVGSNFIIIGKARGAWFFEASFPIEVLDERGKLLSSSIAQAQGEWMTADFVPFKASITIPESYKGAVTLVLKKDNPSGLAEHDASISFVVNKEISTSNNTTTKVYYYNPTLDQGVGGANCSQAGITPLLRLLPHTITPIQDTIKILLRGEISDQEKSLGITTEFPLEGLTLQSASLSNGNLTLTFLDPKNKTIGGSCRTAILRNQIEATAKQFKEVHSVRLLPEELFQP